MKRLAVALFALPLLAMVAYAALACLGPMECTFDKWIVASLVGAYVVLFAFWQLPLLLVASFWFLLRFRLVAGWHFVLGGAVVGAASDLPYAWSMLQSTEWSALNSHTFASLFWIRIAAASAGMGVLWLVAIWRNGALTAQTLRP